MPELPFQQVDVFSSEPFKGNPVAVVIGADDLSDRQMADFAKWTNLSETTFVLTPTTPQADYRVRIFTQVGELPFAGHPTLGTCHAWLTNGGTPRGDAIMQECGVGLVPVRRQQERLAFAAPALLRSGPLDEALLVRIAKGLGIEQSSILHARWADNGPGWIAVQLGSKAEVLALDPDYAALSDLKIGVVGAWDAAQDGPEAQFEVRAFAMGVGVKEDPVTGSLNAALGQWLIGSGRAPRSYVASQGTALGRAGRVHVDQIGDDIWIGGVTRTNISGRVSF
ncbi:PhzF family phenazine biosynthesis protein [Paracoccus benzoatiresistens]|uniref:PhzF family phenazine biosynthesis protein n=1 Tax=Paracoccus benzoatiresistens TaxID=2997341 RepID=A0ABT4JAA8_9RHOB|nr:PhzF family phenazine biosynthesis protein [Paracoccus sp. EF6]MCZ0963401.1 PhzF family phenazine biosynthesis protein [Paracoccus sp. EF6]